MKELGVRRIIGPNASGALEADLELGEFVVCDQFVDRTAGAADTFYEGPETTHVSAADPYCPELRALLVETARELGIPVRDGGTVVVIQGPRFSTRAESKWFQDAGLGHDQHDRSTRRATSPASSSSATRTSRWSPTTTSASRAPSPSRTSRSSRVFEENNERLRELLFAVIPKIGPQPEDVCATALRGARI